MFSGSALHGPRWRKECIEVTDKQTDLYKQPTTRIAIAAITVIYGMALIDYFRPATFGSEYLESYTLLSLANKIVLIALLINGTLIGSQKFKIIKLALGVRIMGGMMKILHLPSADLTITLASATILIAYILHFYLKPVKKILDILKLATVVLLEAPIVLSVYGQSIAYDVQFAGELMCVVTFLYFLYAERKSYLRTLNP